MHYSSLSRLHQKLGMNRDSLKSKKIIESFRLVSSSNCLKNVTFYNARVKEVEKVLPIDTPSPLSFKKARFAEGFNPVRRVEQREIC